MVRLKESVFDDPGAPTIMSGVFVAVSCNTQALRPPIKLFE